MPKLTFEKQLARLEEIVEKLEGETTDLDASVKLFEEGMALSQELSQKLCSRAAGRRYHRACLYHLLCVRVLATCGRSERGSGLNGLELYR